MLYIRAPEFIHIITENLHLVTEISLLPQHLVTTILLFFSLTLFLWVSPFYIPHKGKIMQHFHGFLEHLECYILTSVVIK